MNVDAVGDGQLDIEAWENGVVGVFSTDGPENSHPPSSRLIATRIPWPGRWSMHDVGVMERITKGVYGTYCIVVRWALHFHSPKKGSLVRQDERDLP